MKIINVCGARPNFMKIAPLMRAFAARPGIDAYLVHTGQHYDAAMDKAFFDDLHIPRPDVNLEVGSASHAVQTAMIMERFEPIVLRARLDAVLVVGDVNSTVACGLVAVKLQIPLIHVEAGLRSFDRTMPEEINRLLTDTISELLFVTEPSGVENLRREGIATEKIHLVGNVMIDTLLAHRQLAAQSTMLEQLGLSPGAYQSGAEAAVRSEDVAAGLCPGRRMRGKGSDTATSGTEPGRYMTSAPDCYAVLTLHRPANVDDPAVFSAVCDALDEIQRTMPLVFPVHPRTRGSLRLGGLLGRLERMENLRLTEPLGYLDFLQLMSSAAVVLTDSGGIQEETTVLGVPCLTLRENTERPITIEQGTNQLVGLDPSRILAAFRQVRAGRIEHRVPELWDGRAAERIAEILLRWHAQRSR